MKKKRLSLIISCIIITQSIASTIPVFAVERNINKVKLEANVTNVNTKNKNREIKFLGLGDWQYADLKVDYNTDKITIQTYKGKPHLYFKDKLYEKIEVLYENGKVVYSKDFIGDKELENSTKEIQMKPGYEIKLTTQEPDRVRIFDDTDKKDTNLKIDKGTDIFRITNNGIVNKFSINKNIQQAYVNDFKNRIGVGNLSKFLIDDIDDSARRGSNHKKFIKWIENNPVALREYLDGGYALN